MSPVLELLKIRLVIWWFRLTKKIKSNGDLMAIRKNGTGVGNVLIILPEGRENSRIARYFLKSVNRNGTVDLHMLMDKTLYHTLREEVPENVKVYGVEDVNWFRLPRRVLIDRVLSRRYHAVVDMHPFFNLATAYLTYLSKAPVRVGFSSRFSPSFFNVEIDRKSSDFIEEGYLSIQKLLNL